VQRLQRICVEKGKDYINWDTYIPRALFAFHAHTNKCWGANLFSLTYGRTALKYLADQRDDASFTGPMIEGDLAMRKVQNRKTNLHPKWDGPFVVYEVTDGNTCQLATSGGYILNNLTNSMHLRKLDLAERKQYRERFWQASGCVVFLWSKNGLPYFRRQWRRIKSHLKICIIWMKLVNLLKLYKSRICY
jgi:hypothetical protein